MEQSCQSQGSKCHGACQSSAASRKANVVCSHNKDADDCALYQQSQHEVFAHDGLFWISWFLIEQVFTRWFHTDCNCRQGVGQEVNEQQVYRLEWDWQCKQRGVENAQDCGHVTRKQELDRILDVCIYITSIGYSLNDGCKVIVCQDHCSSIFRNFRTCDTHCNTDICFFQCRSVVDTVTGHRNDLAFLLPCVYNADLMLWRYTGINRNMFQFLAQFFVAHLVEFNTT